MRSVIMMVVLAALWAGSAPQAHAQAGAILTSKGVSAQAPRNAVSHHEITLAGERIAYTATVADDIIPALDGTPGAAVVTIAYTRDGVAEPRHRPVMFLFNGGPGASSSPLHMSALGPVMRASGQARDASAPTYLDNLASPLDAFDLVFIDPVSTGFSRALPGVDPKQWYDGRQDALEVGRVIADWLRVNARESSPRFLAGESYGTTRVGLMLEYCPELNFDGVLLISGGEQPIDESHPDYVGGVASMAAGAWFHHRIERGDRSVEQVVTEARRFARTEYAAALATGKSLPSDERRRVAEKLATFIGLPASLIEGQDLRVTTNTYMFNLLKEQQLRTGLLDVRVTSPLVENAAGAIDDPSLGVTKPGPKGSKPPTPEAVGAVASPTVARYLHESLGFPSDDPYIGVNFLANVAWKYDPNGDTARHVAARMSRDPALRLYAVSGFYDLRGGGDGTGFLEAGVPAARMTFDQFAGGHQVYDDADNRMRFAEHLRRFVRGQ
jgi:carboxypeptidase C (cathepsin A)